MRTFALALVLLACTVPLAAQADPSDAASDALPTVREIPRGWEIVEEAPGHPAADPELSALGVEAIRARHYTRGYRGAADVCSIEIWGFGSESAARRAMANMHVENWEFVHEGLLVIMLRALRIAPGQPPRREIFDECRTLLGRATQRARADRSRRR